METKRRLGILDTHPIQYHAPFYRKLAEAVDLTVHYAHRQTPEGQAAGGFGVAFEWDVPLLEGYPHEFLENVARRPGVGHFRGCNTPGIKRIIEEQRFDGFLVHGWHSLAYWQAMLACRRTKTPLFVRGDSQLATPRRWWVRAGKRLLYRAFIPRFDACLCVGRRAREYYLHYGASPAKMVFCPHAVDNEWFAERAEEIRPRRTALRRETGADAGDVLLLFCGKFIPKKRVSDLVAAAALLRGQGLPVRLCLVGSGPLEGELRVQAEELGSPVHFAGFRNQSELPAFYVAADLLVLPSDSETWGLVANEGMACGLPAVVSSACGCAPDLIDEGRSGASYPAGDIQSLAGAIRDMLPKLGSDGVREAVRDKVRVYSVDGAVEGVLKALALVACQRRNDPCD
ncbi:MAG: glycosyltransferase family 4 protein [Syntrophobacteraceae bacterium]|nr:glycosyltransferase family 4 protein [Syntrophobacteraceae bacterium]